MYWDKTNKGTYLKLFGLWLSCPSASLALQHGSIVPPEWLAANKANFCHCLACLWT